MNEPIDYAFEAEQELYQTNLHEIRRLDDEAKDAALRSEKRRHMWAVCGIWHGRHSERLRPHPTSETGT